MILQILHEPHGMSSPLVNKGCGNPVMGDVISQHFSGA